MAAIETGRRTFLGGMVGGFFAYAMRNGCEAGLAQQPQGRAKRCLVLWMDGGPSQLDTWDLKPGTSTGGEFQTIATAVPGLEISETLPEMARQMGDLSILRNLTSPEGDHGRAQYYLHTGYQLVPGFPRPSLGSVVSHETPETGFPRYVSIGSRGYGPAFLGPDHAPFSLENAEEAYELLGRIRRRRKRIDLLQDLGSEFDRTHSAVTLDRRRSLISRIDSLVTTPFVEALNLQRASEQDRQRYGESEFATSCLLARRLLEAGVNFVEVQHGGWDTHGDNFTAVRSLCSEIDRPWAMLLEDLRSSGLLAETVVLWTGEFGRTPQINSGRGRDHFPQVTPAVIGGGVIRGGIAVGQTNRLGTEIEGQSHPVADLFATVFAALGIDPAKEFRTSFDSPTSATDKGIPIAALVS